MIPIISINNSRFSVRKQLTTAKRKCLEFNTRISIQVSTTDCGDSHHQSHLTTLRKGVGCSGESNICMYANTGRQ